MRDGKIQITLKVEAQYNNLCELSGRINTG